MWPATWQEPATPQPPAQRAINYRQPVREYKDVRMGDMKVAVEKQLQAEAPQIAAKALARLKSERTHALAALPAKASKQLGGIPFFLMYGPKAKNGGRNNGLEYFQKNAPRQHPELDRRWGDAIVIGEGRTEQAANPRYFSVNSWMIVNISYDRYLSSRTSDFGSCEVFSMVFV